MADDIKTVEVAAEPEKIIDSSPAAPTREELREKGWSKMELDAAEKRGMMAKPEDKVKADADAAAAKTKGDAEAKAKAKAEAKAKADADRLKAGEPRQRTGDISSLPDFTMSPEQEKVFLETFGAGTPPRAMYFRMKNERQARQRIEAERDKLALEVQMRRDADERMKKGNPEPEVDEEGNVIDPDDKPLTMKQLRAMQKAEQEEMDRRQRDLNDRSGKAASALKDQEEYAKSVYPDFDETVKLATDLVNDLGQIADTTKRAKVIKLIRDLQAAAATADKYGVDEYTASMIAYEMGQLHPNYGKNEDPEKNGTNNDKKDPKANGGLTPEQMKRIEENTQRRASSASLPGGSNGRRVINVDDLTVKDVLRMSPEERYQLKKAHPAKMEKLMRG